MQDALIFETEDQEFAAENDRDDRTGSVKIADDTNDPGWSDSPAVPTLILVGHRLRRRGHCYRGEIRGATHKGLLVEESSQVGRQLFETTTAEMRSARFSALRRNWTPDLSMDGPR